MSLRTALQNSRLLTFGIIAGFVWILLNLITVVGAFDWYAAASGDFIGQNAVGGIVGAVVLLVILGGFITLYSEAGETDAAPESWPPSE